MRALESMHTGLNGSKCCTFLHLHNLDNEKQGDELSRYVAEGEKLLEQISDCLADIADTQLDARRVSTSLLYLTTYSFFQEATDFGWEIVKTIYLYLELFCNLL